MTKPEFLKSDVVPFLKANATNLAVLAPEIVEQVVRLPTGQVDETGFAAWPRACTRL